MILGLNSHQRKDAQHLITALQENYEITINWEGQFFCGLNIE